MCVHLQLTKCTPTRNLSLSLSVLHKSGVENRYINTYIGNQVKEEQFKNSFESRSAQALQLIYQDYEKTKKYLMIV